MTNEDVVLGVFGLQITTINWVMMQSMIEKVEVQVSPFFVNSCVENRYMNLPTAEAY